MGNATRVADEERLFRGYTGRISIILGLGMVGSQLLRQVIPPLLPEIRESLTLTSFEAGVLVTTVWASFGLLQYPSGRISDEISRTFVILTGLGLTLLGALSVALAPAYGGLLVGAAFLGGGGSLYVLPTRAMLADMFIEKRGASFGINQAASQFGGALAGGIAVVALTIATWRVAFIAVIPLIVVSIVLLISQSQEEYEIEWVEFEFWAATKRLFEDTRIRILFVSYSLFVFTVQSVLSFLPTFLRETKGFAPNVATWGFSLTFVGALAVMPFSGRLGDEYERLPVAMVALGSGGAGLLIVILSPSLPVVIAGILLFSAGIWSYPPVMQAYLMELFPSRTMGGDFGVFRTGYFLIGSLGPAYMGYLGGINGFQFAYGSIILCVLAGVAITYKAGRES